MKLANVIRNTIINGTPVQVGDVVELEDYQFNTLAASKRVELRTEAKPEEEKVLEQPSIELSKSIKKRNK